MAYKYNPFTGKLDMVGITEGSADFDASNMTYETPGGDQVTVKDQLDDIYGKVFPIKINSVKLNSNNGDITVEYGKIFAIGDLLLEWSLSASPVAQTLSGNTDYAGDITARTAKNSKAVSGTTAYTLRVTDASGNSASVTRNVKFAHRRFAKCLNTNVFPSSGFDTWLNSFKSGAMSTLLTSKSDTVQYGPDGEQYLWYAIPQGLTTSPSWKLNAGSEVSGGMTKKGSGTITNEYGKSIIYDFYCSNQAQTGATTLTLL